MIFVAIGSAGSCSPTMARAFAAREQAELIKSTHVAFRPIDIKMGPDGAIYIADWYNPIIQHGEVDFRDPRRDHTRGRIWRVTAKGRPLVPRPELAGATIDALSGCAQSAGRLDEAPGKACLEGSWRHCGCSQAEELGLGPRPERP